MTKNSMPTVKVSGKDYVLVKDRVLYFNQAFKNGSIRTELVANVNGQVVMKATVIPDIAQPERCFVDYSQEKEGSSMINKTSAMENASTSAIGRALALMGIGVIESIASADEVKKAINHDAPKSQVEQDVLLRCETCGEAAIERSGTSKAGKPYHGIFCSSDDKSHIRWLAAS